LGPLPGEGKAQRLSLFYREGLSVLEDLALDLHALAATADQEKRPAGQKEAGVTESERLVHLSSPLETKRGPQGSKPSRPAPDGQPFDAGQGTEQVVPTPRFKRRSIVPGENLTRRVRPQLLVS